MLINKKNRLMQLSSKLTTITAVASILMIVIALIAISTTTTTSVVDATFFDFGDDLWGVETKRREVLPDGRIRYSVPEKLNAPIPDSVRARIEKKKKKNTAAASDDDDDDDDTTAAADTTRPMQHFSHKLDVTLQPHWKFFSVEKHSDVSRMLCHEPGDVNMRLSLFDISPELLQAINQDFKAVILTAPASKHQCHGQPIFRKIVTVHHHHHRKADADADAGAAGGGEVLLITSKARYEEIFDEADISFEIEHPYLTHVDTNDDDGASSSSSPIFDLEAADYGIDWHAPPQSTGAARVARAPALMYSPREKVAGDPSEAEGAASAPQGNDEAQQQQQQQQQQRNAEAQWSSLKCAPKQTKEKVKKCAKEVKQTTSKVVEAVGKGVKATKDGVIKRETKITKVNVNKNLKYRWSTCDYDNEGRHDGRSRFDRSQVCSTNIGGALFTVKMKFSARILFKLKIQNNELQLFMIKTVGNLGLGAGVKTQTFNDGSGQSEIITITGPKITFNIGPVSVFLETTFPIIGGLSATYTTKIAGLRAGFEVDNNAIFGVQWTKKKGFQMLSSSASWKKAHTVDYPGDASSLIVNLAPYIAATARFEMYSLAIAYPQITLGLDSTLRTDNKKCSKLQGIDDFYIKLSAGLDFEIVIQKVTIMHKQYGPWLLWQKTERVSSWCQKKKGKKNLLAVVLPALAHQQQQQEQEQEQEQEENRNALLLAAATSPPTTSLDDTDNGKVWNAAVTCNATHNFNFDLFGFFNNDSTIFAVIMTSNITDTNDNDNFTVSSQRFLLYMGAQVSLGLNSYADVIEATEAKATGLCIDYDDLKELSKYNTGDAAQPKIPIATMSFNFSATNLDDISVGVPGLCIAADAIVSETIGDSDQPVTQPPGSAPVSQLSRTGTPPALKRLDGFLTWTATGAAIACFIALVEFCLAWQARGFLIPFEYWPKYKVEPRSREVMFSVAAVVWGLIMYTLFAVGGGMQFASIAGARIDPNYVDPPSGSASADSNFLVASGVQVIIYEFEGARVNRLECSQFYPCSPNCRDLCLEASYEWKETPWPWCPSNPNMTDASGCTRFSGAAVAYSVVGVMCLIVGIPIPLLNVLNIYYRAPVANGLFLMSGACLLALWYTIEEFLEETRVEFFSGSIGMVIPFTHVGFSPHSRRLWYVAVIGFFVGVVVNFFLMLWECHKFYTATVNGEVNVLDSTLRLEPSRFVAELGEGDEAGDLGEYGGEELKNANNSKKNPLLGGGGDSFQPGTGLYDDHDVVIEEDQ